MLVLKWISVLNETCEHIVYKIGLNVFISILLQHVSHITTCKFLGLERKHIAYLVLLLYYKIKRITPCQVRQRRVSDLKFFIAAKLHEKDGRASAGSGHASPTDYLID